CQADRGPPRARDGTGGWVLTTIPPTLQQSVQMLRLYISDKRHQKPCFVTGGFGRGRGYWVRAVLHEYGFEPVWLYESVAVLPPKLPTERCIVLMDGPPTDKRDGIVVAFPPPSRQDLMAFVRANGQPESLANGCATYDDAVAAVRVYDASGV